MKRILALCMAACLLLSGCASVFDGSYVSTMPHQEQGGISGGTDAQVSEYKELLTALITLAERGSKSGIIYVPSYDPERVAMDMESAARETMYKSPIAAYAVEQITWELGSHNSQRAVAVNITYYHERPEILKIRRVSNTEEAIQMIYKELDDSSAGVVMYLDDYSTVDFVQLVKNYAFDNPQAVMEMPQVTANVYPKSGSSRVVELKFTYQHSREELRRMKSQVLSLYLNSKYFVSANAETKEKFAQLYSYLMERGFGEYTIETSNTPAFSLLWHGAGDSKAFATLFASICRLSELECQVVTGTRDAESWYWNLVKIDGSYYHVDLLRSHETGGFRMKLDSQMVGYVWNYSAYPATPEQPEPTESSEPTVPPAATETQPE